MAEIATANYATLYQTAIENEFFKDLRSVDLYTSAAHPRMRWIGAKTIQIPRTTVEGYKFVNRDVLDPGNTRSTTQDWSTFEDTHFREV